MFKRLALIAILCVLGLATPLAVLPLRGSTSDAAQSALWFIDLGTHWQLLYVALLACSVTAMAYLRRNAAWLALLVCCALPLATARDAAERAAGASADTFTVASANVYFENEDSRPLAAWIAARNADIVVVSEVSRAFGAQLDQWPAYPHRKILTRDDPFGLAILSRHPFESLEEIQSADGIPHLRAVVKWKDRLVAITAVHPLPPIQTGFMVERDRLLAGESRVLRDRGVPAMLAGDLNATPWSAGFAGPAAMGLRRTTPLLQPSWPQAAQGWMGIPIDHVLVSAHWRVVDSAVGPNVGSDHFPVVTVLQLATPGR